MSKVSSAGIIIYIFHFAYKFKHIVEIKGVVERSLSRQHEI